MHDLGQIKTELRKLAEAWIAEKPKVRGAKLLSRRTGLSYSSCQRFLNDTSQTSLESLLLIASNLLDPTDLTTFFEKHDLPIVRPIFDRISRLDVGGETLLKVFELLSKHSGTTIEEISEKTGSVGTNLLRDLRDQQAIAASHVGMKFHSKVSFALPLKAQIIEAMLSSKKNSDNVIYSQCLNEHGMNKLRQAIDGFLKAIDEVFNNERHWGSQPASIALVSNRG